MSEQKTIRVLIIDDNQDDRLLARRELERGFPSIQIRELLNRQEFEQALELGDFEAVVTDFQLGWTTGLEIVRRLKGRYPDLPVVMFTATANLEQSIEVMKAGLDDYVTKSPKHYMRLPSALGSALARNEAVTAHKRSEQLLREQDVWMRGTLNGLTEGVITADSNGQVRSCNPECERLTGWPLDSVLGRDVDEVLHLADAQGQDLPESPARRALREQQPNADSASDYRVIHRSGKQTPVISSAAPIQTGTGDLCGVVATIRDITDRKRTELQLLRSNEELQQFAYAASHDLQEPLRTMILMSQLLAKRLGDSVGPEEQRLIETVEAAGRRMTAQIKGLLEYGRLADNHARISEFSADEAAHAAMENLKAYIEERHASVQCDPLPKVAADRIQLMAVFQNLISNGIKYNESPTPTVHIGVRETAGLRLITVRDNGIGIPAEFRNKVFRIFSRLHPKRYSGTGIGLALAKRILQRADGDIWLDDSPEPGSTFLIRLPWA